MRKNWHGETCSRCTREQRLAWSVRDDLWQRVVPAPERDGTLCLECFLRMADDKGTVIALSSISFQGTAFREEASTNE